MIGTSATNIKTQAGCNAACGTGGTYQCTKPTDSSKVNTCGVCSCLDKNGQLVVNSDISIKNSTKCKSSCEKNYKGGYVCVPVADSTKDTGTKTDGTPITYDCSSKVPKERGIFTRGLSTACLGCGNCTQCDVFQVIANIVSFIFSIAGALAVFFMVNAGFSFATARGNQEAITKAKGALAAVVIGVIIVLLAWALVNTVLSFWLEYDQTKFKDWFAPNFNC